MKPRITAEEMAAHLGIQVLTLTKLARAGKLPAYKPFGRWLFDPVEVDAYIASRGNAAVRDMKRMMKGRK